MSNTIENLLLVRRNPVVLLRDESAKFGSGQDIGIPPFRRSPTPALGNPNQIPVNAYESGTRSALFELNGVVYRGKGVAPEEGRVLEFSPGSGRFVPFGTQLLEHAEDELLMAEQVGKGFGKLDLPYPMHPIDSVEYDYQFEGQPCGGGIFRVDGDTRMDELLYAVESKVPYQYLTDIEARYIRRLLGSLMSQTGQAVKLLHQLKFVWNQGINNASNSHLGNIVVFNSDGSASVAPIDLDGAEKRPGTGLYWLSKQDTDDGISDQEYARKIARVQEAMDSGDPQLTQLPEYIFLVMDHSRSRVGMYKDNDLGTFRASILDTSVLMTKDRLDYDPNMALVELVRGSQWFGRRRMRDNTLLEHIKGLKSQEESLRKYLLERFNKSYDDYSYGDQFQQVSWDNVRNLLVADIPQIREDLSKRARSAFTTSRKNVPGSL